MVGVGGGQCRIVWFLEGDVAHKRRLWFGCVLVIILARSIPSLLSCPAKGSSRRKDGSSRLRVVHCVCNLCKR